MRCWIVSLPPKKSLSSSRIQANLSIPRKRSHTFLPIFLASNGDIYQLSPLIATLYAMISKVQSFDTSASHPKPAKKSQTEPEPVNLLQLLKSADSLATSEVQEATNNPYHFANKKEKLKVISNKIKERMSFKIKKMFKKKEDGSAAPTNVLETAEGM